MPTNRFTLGYCTNIHSGTDFEALIRNLENYAGPVAAQSLPLDAADSICNRDGLGVGLWIPHEAAGELATSERLQHRLKDTMQKLRLVPYTLNGFPYGNFHQPIVKHRVYEPKWWEADRLEYTLQLIRILDAILPAGDIGSISTLPLGWSKVGDDFQSAAAENLRLSAEELRALEDATGRRIVIAIEPEPGCHFDRGRDVVEFFDRYLDDTQRRYITVCHDVCHAAVMQEPQAELIRLYAEHGIVIGKIQISSAIAVDWTTKDAAAQHAALSQLGSFAEDRYLHQTGRLTRDGQFLLEEDLPELLTRCEPQGGAEALPVSDQAWCIHFHVPIFLQDFGQLSATQLEITDCLQAVQSLDASQFIPHLEIETYAWTVMPPEMQAGGMVESLAQEVKWLEAKLGSLASSPHTAES